MKRFFGVLKVEYFMSTRRWGLWLAFTLLFLIYFLLPSIDQENYVMYQTPLELLNFVGFFSFQLNLFFPVVAGIVIADRMARDQRLNVTELLQSTPLDRWSYIAGKYFGSVLSVLTPVALFAAVLCIQLVFFGMPVRMLPIMLAAFLSVNVPAYLFISAFSLACPLIMPVRVYQVLFTGYWFWGNFLNPDVMPTLAGTLLTPGGRWVLEGFFNDLPVPIQHWQQPQIDAILNLGVLAGCTLLALLVLERYLAWQAQRA